MIGALTSAALCWKTDFVSGVVSPITTGTDDLIIPAFSPAIFLAYYQEIAHDRN